MTTRPQILPRDAAMKKGDAYGAVPTGKRCGRATSNRSRNGLKNKSSSCQIRGGRGPQPAPVIFKKRKYKPASQWKRPAAKPCGCIWGSCMKCVKTGHKNFVQENLIKPMYADYQAGMTLGKLGKKYPTPSGKPRSCTEIKGLFIRRGLAVRPTPAQCLHQLGNKGCFKAVTPKTPKELEAIIAGMNRLQVPPAIKQEWRRWPMQKRGDFIRKVREKLKMPSRPSTPFSSNVEPFDYTSPRAHEIQMRDNASHSSQTFRAKVKISSQGVIFEEKLYFWVASDSAYRQGPYVEGIGRTALHHLIYERHHGPIPPKQTVIHLDGNKNNFDPKNLALRSMADCARMNHWRHNPELVRGGIAKRIAVKSWLNRGRKMNAVARAQVGALLGGGNGLFEQLTRSQK